MRVAPDGSRQGDVAGEQMGIERLGQSHIGRIVGRKVRPQMEYPRKQGSVAVPDEGQVQVVPQGRARPLDPEPASQEGAPEHGRELDVAEGGRVEVAVRRFHDRPRGLAALRPEQVLGQGRGVHDDELQAPSRRSRSARTSSAAGRPSSTLSRFVRRSNTSSGGGRATSRSKIPCT